MPLKRLELSNFKSYRGEQVIDFGPSFFTCIIGPNGSGKSNLMDAISFVLGVKSAQLRSTQLKELIYRGRKAAEGPEDEDDEDGGEPSQRRGKAGHVNGKGKKANGKGKAAGAKKTLGKRKTRDADSDATTEEEDEASADEDDEGSYNDASSAWVAAIYEDEAGREWVYKRAINRTGTSSYALNGSTVAYLAYNQSLEKHNILVKAKNFLVFQGDVEAVASQSPKDLAKLIDQISGSLDLAPEYLAAKARSDKSTDVTTLNFSKKRGIQNEAKQFREQKLEVEHWKEMQQEKADMIVKFLLWRLFHIEEAIETSREAIEEKQGVLAELAGDVAAEQKTLAAAKKKHAKSSLEMRKQEDAVKAAERALEEKRPELLKVQTQIEHANKKIKTSRKLVDGLEQDQARQEQTVKNLERDLADAEKAKAAAAETQRVATAKRGVVVDPADLEEYRKLKAAAASKAVDERQHLDGLQREERGLRDKMDAAKDKLSKSSSRRDELRQELGSVEAKEQAYRQNVTTFERDRKAAQKEMDTVQAEKTRYHQMETELNEKLQDAYNKLLQAKVDRRESDREVKLKEALANLRKVFPGVHGRVIDLCKPTQEKYNAAIQVVLGRNIDSVVVDHQKTAIECIEYMRNQRAGQATFIPLDTIVLKDDGADKFRNAHKGARLAIDVIQYEPTVERAMQYACGTSLVCDTEEIAKHLRFSRNLPVKAVTLDGTVIHKSGLMTGGQTSGTGRKFDDVEISGIEKQRDSNLAKLRDLQATRPKSDNDNRLTTEISRLNASLAIAKDHLISTSRIADGLRSEVKTLNKTIEKLQTEAKTCSDRYTAHAAKVAKVASVVDKADDAVFAAFCRRLRVKDVREFESVQIHAAALEDEALGKYNTQIARLNHQLSFERKQLAATEERLQSVLATIEKQTSNIETVLSAQEDGLTAEIEEAETEVASARVELQQIKDRGAETARKVDDARSAYNRAVKALDQAKKDVASLYDEIDKRAGERFAIYKRCKLEEIDLPLEAGRLDKVPIDESAGFKDNADADDINERSLPDDFGIRANFDELDEDEQGDASEDVAQAFEQRISTLTSDIEKMAPNLKAVDKLDDVEDKLRATEREAEEAKRENKEAKDTFNKIKKRRCDLFNKAFNHISERIDPVYKELTKGKAAPQGGVAYLSLEDNDEPYLSGIKYHAMPPMKRFRDMEQLSGGEKTMAALALLFAIHSYQPSPFFVLDEVDAALDNTNVGRIANYIRTHASATFQFIVISLKGSLYERSNSLVGIYRDQDVNSSRSLTLDLQKYNE